jgi:hypothetical protein
VKSADGVVVKPRKVRVVLIEKGIGQRLEGGEEVSLGVKGGVFWVRVCPLQRL